MDIQEIKYLKTYIKAAMTIKQQKTPQLLYMLVLVSTDAIT